MSGITWVYSETGGYYPCSTSQELSEFKKAGFWECGGSPSDHKNGLIHPVELLIEKKPNIEQEPEPEPEQSNELSKDDLIALAEDSGVHVDRRWSVPRIKDVLGL